MSKFIRMIGRAYFNNVGFDVYENEDGSATVRPVKLWHDFPKKHWIKFDSLDHLEEWLDKIDLSGVELVAALQELWLSDDDRNIDEVVSRHKEREML